MLRFMNKNSISQAEAFDLFEKLISERTRVIALFTSTAGVKIIFWGFVRSLSRDTLVMEMWPPSVQTGTLEVPLKGRNCKYGYMEARELSESAERTARQGDIKLLLKFSDPVEILFLSFTFG
jgi:hypothetical protein